MQNNLRSRSSFKNWERSLKNNTSNWKDDSTKQNYSIKKVFMCLLSLYLSGFCPSGKPGYIVLSGWVRESCCSCQNTRINEKIRETYMFSINGLVFSAFHVLINAFVVINTPLTVEYTAGAFCTPVKET